MKLRALQIILFLALLAGGSAGFSLDSTQIQCAGRVVDSIMLCRFEGGLSIGDSLSKAAPQNPLGPFLSLCVRVLRDVDYNRSEDSVNVLLSFKSVMQRIDALQSRPTNGAQLGTLEGLAKAVYAAHCLNGQRYSQGVQIGLQALRILKQVKTSNPSDYEADFILGSYECGKAELRQRLWWVLFWYPGTTSQGIAMLKRCSEGAIFSGRAADLALAEIFIKEKKFDLAKKYIDKLSSLYPGSRFVLWAKVKYYDALANKQEGLRIYTELEQGYRSSPDAWRNLMSTRYQRARILNELGQKQESSMLLVSLLQEYESRNDPVAKAICKDARELLKGMQR